MSDLWDSKSDLVERGDCRREICPIPTVFNKDVLGFTHYIFSNTMFVNPKYNIPLDGFQLFENFLLGGSRSYPSDGKIPVDVASSEAKIILNRIEEISQDPNHQFHKEAIKVIKENGKYGMVRGTIKLYLGNYTTSDWRRKRFTDDIDFWIFSRNLLEFVLTENGWVKNKETKEYEKSIQWFDFNTNTEESGKLIASNDIELMLDFGAGSYLDGSALRDIFKKKIKRGHEVDLSDIINVAIIYNDEEGELDKEWTDIWDAVQESVNTRSTRTTSNIISLCRYSYGVAKHLERVSRTLRRYKKLILDGSKYPLNKIITIYRHSDQWLSKDKIMEINIIRNKIYEELLEQEKFKHQQSINLKNFTKKILEKLNSSYCFCKVIFEVKRY